MFFISDKPSYNGPRSLQKHPPDCIILEIMSADELFAIN